MTVKTHLSQGYGEKSETLFWFVFDNNVAGESHMLHTSDLSNELQLRNIAYAYRLNDSSN